MTHELSGVLFHGSHIGQLLKDHFVWDALLHDEPAVSIQNGFLEFDRLSLIHISEPTRPY